MTNLLDASRKFQLRRAMVERRTIRVANPKEQDLDYLLNHADVILLPITQGGGSNIKTAEALLSDRSIIGTSTAFRGFETFKNSPGVIVQDDASEFRRLVRDALTGRLRFPARGRDARELLWENCVREIPPTMERLLAA